MQHFDFHATPRCVFRPRDRDIFRGTLVTLGITLGSSLILLLAAFV